MKNEFNSLSSFEPNFINLLIQKIKLVLNERNYKI